jgi:hypothetical protein
MDLFTGEDPVDWRSLLMPPAEGLADLPSQEAGPELAAAVMNGVAITGKALDSEGAGLIRIVDDEGRLLAVYNSDGSVAKAEVVLS